MWLYLRKHKGFLAQAFYDYCAHIKPKVSTTLAKQYYQSDSQIFI